MIRVSLLSGFLPAILCLQALPSLLPWNHELLLLHILTAKASCSTANPHCPLTGTLEMKKQTHKHTNTKK